MSVLLHQALVILVSENALTILNAGGHEVAALNVTVANDDQYFEEALVEEASDLEDLLHDRVD